MQPQQGKKTATLTPPQETVRDPLTKHARGAQR